MTALMQTLGVTGSIAIAGLLSMAGAAAPASAQCIARPSPKITATDGAPGDIFGMSVAVEGDFAVVGALWDDDNGFNSGSAYVFGRGDDGRWIQHAKLLATDGAAEDVFGRDVAISGETIAVGANGDNAYRGAVYVFVKEAGGHWVQQAKLVASDAAPNDVVGWRVDISGDRIVTGGHRNGVAGPDSGSAYVFERDAGGVWTESARLAPKDLAAGDAFGHDVAISGDTLLVGAYKDDDDGESSGSVYVYERQPEGFWRKQAKLTASDANQGYHFGRFVDLDGDTALIGSPFWWPLNYGAAYVFERTGLVWTETAQLTADIPTTQEWFASAVAISGDTAVIGSFYINNDDPGEAYLFRRHDGAWLLQEEITADDGVNGDAFGRHVALDGTAVFVTSTNDDDNGPDSGSVYAHEVVCPSPDGDVNGDGLVDMRDLLLVLANWGGCPIDPAAPCIGDTNDDGQVDLVDVQQVLTDWS